MSGEPSTPVDITPQPTTAELSVTARLNAAMGANQLLESGRRSRSPNSSIVIASPPLMPPPSPSAFGTSNRWQLAATGVVTPKPRPPSGHSNLDPISQQLLSPRGRGRHQLRKPTPQRIGASVAPNGGPNGSQPRSNSEGRKLGEGGGGSKLQLGAHRAKMQAVLDAVQKRMGESEVRINAHNRWAAATVRVIGEESKEQQFGKQGVKGVPAHHGKKLSMSPAKVLVCAHLSPLCVEHLLRQVCPISEPPTPVSPRGKRRHSFDSLSTKEDGEDGVAEGALVVAPTEGALIQRPIDGPALPLGTAAAQHQDEEDLTGFGIDKALYCFSRENMLRAVCIKIATNVWFERASMTVIGFNCVTMAMFDPFDPDCETDKCQILEYLDLTWSSLFIIEMCTKLVAMGFCGDKRSYWADPWNRLDFCIVMMSLTDFVPGLSGGPLKIIRIARVLRPLRAINKLPALRILIRMIMKTMPMLGSVASLVAFIFVVFAILGVQLFQGMLRRRCFTSDTTSDDYWDDEMGGGDAWICTMPMDTGMNSCAPDDDASGNYSVCREDGPNPNFGSLSFDHIGYAWVTIFMVIGMEGWTDILYMVQDAYSFWVWIYFIILIMIGSLVAMNLFLVVIATQFGVIKQQELATMRKEQEAEALLRADEPYELTWREKLSYFWMRTTIGQIEAERLEQKFGQQNREEKLRIAEEKRLKKEAAGSDSDDDVPPDDDQLDAEAYEKEFSEAGKLKQFVMDKRVENFILGVIVLNTMVMTTEAYGQEGTDIVVVQHWLTMLCNVVFTIEMGVKLYALGCKRYCSEAFNIFDGTLVCITLFEIIQAGADNFDPHAGGGGGLTALRTLRLIRLVKLMRRFKQLQLQVKVLVESLSAISSFCVLLGLYMFVYAILGMFLFGAQFCTGDEDCYGSRSNFNTFYRSFVTVFQLLTIEDWPGVMFDAVRYTHYISVFYFISLLGSGTYILCNLFIAILLDSFAERAAEEEARAMAILRKRQDRSPEAVQKLQNFRAAFSGKNSQYMFDHWKGIWKASRASQQPSPQVPAVPVASPLATLPGESADNSGYLHPLLADGAEAADGMAFEANPLSEPAAADEASDQHPALMISPEMANQIDSQAFVMEECTRGSSTGEGGNENKPMATTGPTGFSTGFSASPDAQAAAAGKESPIPSPVGVTDTIRAHEGLSAATDWPADGSNRKKLAVVVETEMAPQAAPQVTEEEKKRRASIQRKQDAVSRNARELMAVLVKHIKCEVGLVFHDWRSNAENTSLLCKHKRQRTLCKQCMDGGGGSESSEVEEDPDALQKKSLCCCLLDWKVRRMCIAISKHKMFDHFILLLIGLNSCTMALERRGIGDGERMVLDCINYTFSGFFVLELLVKVTALGVYGKKNAYLADGWNRLDSFLVTLSVVDLMFTLAKVNGGSMLSILKILRILRALRPLRVINKAPKLKKIVGCMVEACKSISSTLVIVAFVFLIFAIFGVNLFGGKLYHCMSTDDTCDGFTCSMGNGLIVETKADCESLAATNPQVLWKNKTYNWDNVGEAVMSLFYVVSLDGWVGLMYEAVDAVGVDLQPKADANEAMCMFFILFLICGNFFVLNLFVGVIVDSFNNSAAGMMMGANDQAKEEDLLKKEEAEEARLTKADNDAYYARLSGFRLKLFGLANAFKFEMFITGVIVANVLVMAMEFYDQPYEYGLMLECLNNLFSFIFFCEFVIKIIPYAPKRYFQDPWNKFDSFIVFVSFVGVFFDYIYKSDAINPTFIRVLRVFRVARIMKLIKSAKGLQALLDTVLQSMGQVASIALLLFLIFFIFAAAGVQMFMYLDCPDTNPCDGIDKHAHFENWPMAMLTLFRIATGDNGNGILADALRQEPLCSAEEDCESNCCASSPRPIIPVFFILFTVMAQFILLNIVVAVLMAQLEESQAYAREDAPGLDLSGGGMQSATSSAATSVEPSPAVKSSDTKKIEQGPDKLDLDKTTKDPRGGLADIHPKQDSTEPPSMGTDPIIDGPITPK